MSFFGLTACGAQNQFYHNNRDPANRNEFDYDPNPSETSCEFKSATEYREKMKSNRFPTKSLQEKYRKPLTASQEIGWQATCPPPEPPSGAVLNKRLPKKSCEETRFARALHEGGWY
eukprot:TRINITY_DN32901_c0_g1_i1.p2 TRINITY_DN32901_c0_g1~~TRINITY_DN32901_c0_g1_i1.p2  ORF type:complete len:117 (+),score=24.58 TRINITY_DN32901_c0_g1_i1:210-560(+)